MKRRIYKLKTKFTLLGMDPVDWGIIIGTFVVSVRIFQTMAGDRLGLLLSLVSTAAVFFVWHLVKDSVPEHFSTHIVKWMGEPEVYKVVPDLQNVPLFVDFDEVRRVTGKGEVQEREDPFTDHLHVSKRKPQTTTKPLSKFKLNSSKVNQPSPHPPQES
jgi:hypothetical protein